METTSTKIVNCFLFGTDFPRSLFVQNLVVIEGRGEEARRLLKERGFARLQFRFEFVHEDWPDYIGLWYRVPKWRMNDFCAVLLELEKKMLIQGYLDYGKACGAIFDAIESKKVPSGLRRLVRRNTKP